MAESKLMSIKLLIDKNEKRVLFAEAGKDCVDFLFFILTLPVSTLIRVLGKQQMVGCLANLYESIETLNESYIQPNMTKATLLTPPGYSVPLLSIKTAPQIQSSTRERLTLYRCSVVKRSLFYNGHYCETNCLGDYSDDPRAICPKCGSAMNKIMTYIAPPEHLVGQQQDDDSSSSSGEFEGGFVKDVVTYMVMDDLVVKPMSTISSITLLAQFNIKDVSALEEKVVNLGINEAVKLLKASMVSKNVLTHVFL